MHDLPYVRNAPLLSVGESVSSGAVELLCGDVAIELRSSVGASRMNLESAAQHLTTTWNFHDPLVDSLRALAKAPQDNIAIKQAQRVLAAITLPEGAVEDPHDEPAPWLPRPEPTPLQLKLQCARSHLSEGFRLTCLAAPQYSEGGRDELMKAQEVLAQLAALLVAK
jgi:hypothetical protein